jgi:hypothetical protein
MAAASEDKTSNVTVDGRRITDVGALLRDPKVKETIKKLSRNGDRFRPAGALTFLTPRKSS